MSLAENIKKLRKAKNLSQENFAAILNVSRQAIQKWENGTAYPDLLNLKEIAKSFGISLDALILDSNSRMAEELKFDKEFSPEYSQMHEYELYSANLAAEYTQCLEEGLDISSYKNVIYAISQLPLNKHKEKLADVIFDITQTLPKVENYPYYEPSDLEEIKNCRKPYPIPAKTLSDEELYQKVYGAWIGRVCGCLLGKAVECIHTNELHPFLKETGNFPLHRYIRKADLTDEICNKYTYPFLTRSYADDIEYMPMDDDTNYTVLAQVVIDKYGRDFTAYDMSRAWLDLQPKNSYCTAERVAFINFVAGYTPPQSAQYRNPFREWIGAQIRGDYFGYINPGDPETAADMAFRDASISHIKNGIYGEMFIAAMLACAAVSDNIEDIIMGGLAEIPSGSRLYEAIMNILNGYHNGVTQEECFENIHKEYDEYTTHGWCHTISNAMIVVASLLYGNNDYGKSICMSVETGFDTDCNGATVGSILGMKNGIQSIDKVWSDPIQNKVQTTIFNMGIIDCEEFARHTIKHIKERD